MARQEIPYFSRDQVMRFSEKIITNISEDNGEPYRLLKMLEYIRKDPESIPVEGLTNILARIVLMVVTQGVDIGNELYDHYEDHGEL